MEGFMKTSSPLFAVTLSAVLVPGMATAIPAGVLPGTEYIACIGASDLGSRWFQVVNDTTGQVHPAENVNLLDGYQAVCDVLGTILPRRYAVSIQAPAGAMSFTLDETSGNLGGLLPSGYHAEALGYVDQLEKALRDNQWSGENRIAWVVLSLANDADPHVMTANAKLAIDIARDAGIPVIVQAFPTWGTFSFVYQYENAVELHGKFWGDVIRKLGLKTITEDQYNALRDFHRAELASYPGVRYVDFYGKHIDWRTTTIDGIHPQYSLALRAARKLQGVMGIDYYPP
jgi:lysophospholipase L1-like esterase